MHYFNASFEQLKVWRPNNIPDILRESNFDSENFFQVQKKSLL